MSDIIRHLDKALAAILNEGRVTRPTKSFKSLRRRRRAKKFNKSWTWREEPMSSNTNELFLASSDLSDHITTKLMFKREGKDTLMEEITLIATKLLWVDFAKRTYNGTLPYRVIHYSNSGMIIINEDTTSWMSCELNANAITIKVYGTREEIDAFVGQCSSEFEIAESYIEWMYSSDGSSVNVPLRTDRTPLSEMYPFLGEESIEEYYDRYIESDASILLLIGPPGTGKTTFIRGLLQHTRSSAVVTYDATILEKDYVFAQFIEGEANVMVMEDADTFLKARSDGNSMMHRFLNVGDGLVTTKGKKLVFSTNLPSIRDVDAALVRPGRCFDILHFDNLTKEQAVALAKKVDIDPAKLTKDSYSIAEIFNGEVQQHANKTISRKVGFM